MPFSIKAVIRLSTNDITKTNKVPLKSLIKMLLLRPFFDKAVFLENGVWPVYSEHHCKLQFVIGWAMIRNIADVVCSLSWLSQRQIGIHRPLEWGFLFELKDKVYSYEKLVFRSGVRFLFLFVLTDAILRYLDYQKRTLVLDYPPNGRLFVYQKCITYPEIGNLFLIFNIKLS